MSGNYKNNHKGSVNAKLVFIIVALAILFAVVISAFVYFLTESQISKPAVPTVKTAMVTKKITKKQTTPIKELSAGKFFREKLAKVILGIRGVAGIGGKDEQPIPLNPFTGIDNASAYDPILDAMPDRAVQVVNPVNNSKRHVMFVDESSFLALQTNARLSTGKKNPFVKEKTPPKMSDLIAKGQPKGMPMGNNINILPDFSNFGTMPPPPQVITKEQFISMNSIIKPVGITVDLLERTFLTGVIDNKTAILNINGESRALKAGENYRGIHVLSIHPDWVMLKYNGKSATKGLYD